MDSLEDVIDELGLKIDAYIASREQDALTITALEMANAHLTAQVGAIAASDAARRMQLIAIRDRVPPKAFEPSNN